MDNALGRSPRARSIGLRRALRGFERTLLELLAPPHCAACGAALAVKSRYADRALCPRCAAGLEPMPRSGCPRCGELLPVRHSGRPLPCVHDHRTLRGLHARRAVWRYRRTGGGLVRAFKYHGDPAARGLLNRGLLSQGRDLPVVLRRAVVVAVPMHRRRRRERGRDHAAELAASFAAGVGAEFVAGALRRRRATLPQADPRVLSRERNVAGVFEVARARAVGGRQIVLIDDVSTSGATARGCAEVLRRAGATRVVLLVAALG